MKAVQLLINSLLPEDLRDYTRTYDTKAIGKLLSTVAERYPDRYAEIAKGIADVGRKASYLQGETLHLDDLRPTFDRASVFAKMDQEIDQARAAAPSDAEFKQTRDGIWGKYSDAMEKMTSESALKAGNNLAYSVVSGARGKAPQLKAMITTPGLYADYRGDTIPLFVRNSFSEGLRPAEFIAGTFGARSSVLCLAEGTLVRMANGVTKAIETIEPGEFVLGSDSEGNTAPTKVVRCYNQGLKPVYSWKFNVGTSDREISLECTENHKVLCNHLRDYGKYNSQFQRGNTSPAANWRDTYHKKYVDPIGVNAQKFKLVLSGPCTPWEGHREPWAFVLGLLLGDGCCTWSKIGRGTRMMFSCADPSLVEEMNSELNPVGFKVTKTCAGNYDHEITRIDYNAGQNLSIVSGKKDFQKGKRFAEKQMLHDMGIIGKYAHEKQFPIGFEKWDHESICELIAGLLSSDGGVALVEGRFPHVTFYVTSRVLAEQLKDLLQWAFGVHAGCVRETKEITRNGEKALRNHQLWGFGTATKVSMDRLAPVFAKMKGIKAVRVRALAASYKLKQEMPYPKAGRRRSEFLGDVPCYDLEVDNQDHLFVLANGVVVSNSTKRATADGGDWGKQLGHVASTISISSKDCGTVNGIDLEASDPSMRGRVLARETEGISAGTVIDRQVLKQLQNHKGKILVRSALTCQAEHGVCAHCAGQRMDGRMPKIGEMVGVAAAQALSEPLIQSGLNSKHTAGQAKGKRVFSGFDAIDNFVQAPETFPDRAEVASQAGRVTRIEKAPQGGQFVHIGDKPHYVQPGYDLLVKAGDTVEAGDQLSDGIMDAADVVKYRGLGEGRRYYAERLKQVLDDSGLAAHQGNTELLARAAIDHVTIDDANGLGDHLPDDSVSYNGLSASYVPPESTKKVSTDGNVVGKYLQAPALHYSIGTQLTPKMVTRMKDAGITDLQVDDAAPKFYPEMVRLRSSTHNNPDWLARMSTSYLKDGLADAAVRGLDTNIESNRHWAPRLAAGVGFGSKADVTGKF